MTEENNRKILHYLNLRKKILTKKPKKFNFSPKFYHKDSHLTLDSIYSSKNSDNNISESQLFTNKKPKRIGNNVKQIEYLYSPRTSYILEKEKEEKLYNDLCAGFDPMTIKIIKLYFKERFGELNEIEFISILKNYLPNWNPDLNNREKILIELLSRLFKDIDLNCNEIITWEDFTYFLTKTSNNMRKKIFNYDLRLYKHAKNTLEGVGINEFISYAFYIEKYNLIGIIIENNSIIEFYDADSFKKTKAVIDVRKIQIDIDKIQMKEFDVRAQNLIEKEDKMKKIKLIINKENRINSYSLRNINIKEKIEKVSNDIKNDMKKRLKRIKTPDKLKEEIKEINNNALFEKKKKEFNKKLSILASCFVNEMDILFVSSSNNKISAWKYINGEFINVNQYEEEIIDQMDNVYAVFDSYLPQYTLDFEPVKKRLYSGQADGKILVWDTHKTKNLDIYTLDFHKAKAQKEQEIKRKINDFKFSQEENKLSQIKNSVKLDNTEDFKNKEKQDLLFNLGIKMLENVKRDMNRESVSCLKILGKMQLLAAGYYNGHIILWDTLLHEYRKYYNDQTTGIYQIEYNIIKNLIFTCGFDHSIYIYDPFVDGYCIQKLVGHNYSINSIAFNIANDELISIDIIGNIKIWDLNNNYNFQNINTSDSFHYLKKSENSRNKIPNKISSNQKMIFLNKVNKIFTYGEKLMIFGKESYYFPDLCDSQTILGCFYDHKLCLLYTICLKKIKIWNIFNGKLIRVYEEYFSNIEILSFCTDEMINRLYIGDNSGNIVCLNLNYGSIIREFIPHKKEVISLCYYDKDNLLISLGIDNNIKIHNENETGENEIKKEIYLDNYNISTLNISSEYSQILIGTTQGEMKYFDLNHLKIDSVVIDSNYKKRFKNDSIVSTLLLDEYPICLIFHESGRNLFEIIPPHLYNYIFFGEFTISPKFEESNKIKTNSKIISHSLDKKNRILYLGDMQGYINCYSIKEILNLFDSGIFDLNKDEIKLKKKSEEKIRILKNCNLEFLFCFMAHNEPIKYLNFFDINPSILVTVGNDRKVKLFTPKGKYIDELRQSMEKNKEMPIGIKYYFSDPFVSKINSDEIKHYEIVYRKDIHNFKFKEKRILLDKMRKVNMSILDYSNKISQSNAQERLYLLTKNCGLENNRSTPWKYMPDLDLIINEEKKDFENKMKEIRKIEVKYNINNSYEALYNDSYFPKFFKDVDELKVKEFGDKLNLKLNAIKLALSKYEKNDNEYETYKEEIKRKENINYQTEIKLLHGYKNIRKKKLDKKNKYYKERNLILGVNRFKNINNQFYYYKEDFNRNLEQLENKINLSFNRIHNNNDFFNNKKKNINHLTIKNGIKKKLLPSLDNDLRRKCISPPNIITKIEKGFNKNKIKLKKVHFS